MAICQFNRYGYCKFGLNCRHQHVNELCEELDCDYSKCLRRHPKSCKYFRKLGRCKFGDLCSYAHISSADDTSVYGNEGQFRSMTSSFSLMDNIIKNHESEIMSIKVKLNSLEKEN